PTFRAGQVVLTGQLHNVKPGEVIVIRHQNLDKIKRVAQVDSRKGVYVLGDNAAASMDSRSFGWIGFDEIIGKVLWPRRTR
ncbi:MAG TPA: S26 family signal peptidase, partial [Candidatus Saccharimonadales bacterium]|nr:S26 family signal peptidase [Candidatus Saccharimonadales bacterium]